MDEAIVMSYLAKLAPVLGDNDGFMPISDELSTDKSVKQPEAVALASRLVFELAASTPRTKALDRIRQKHKDLYMFRLKQRAMDGRSAA